MVTAVQTEQGRLLGTHSIDGAALWLGIAYAAPPTGERRWAPPSPPRPWAGERIADTPGAVSMQREGGVVVGDENCLFLNIYAPSDEAAGSLPVMVWIHGGGHLFGAGHQFDGGTLAVRQNVIIVTVNYRLGVLGWLCHEALADGPAPIANFGLLDIIAALEWVKRNIAGFGGDPRRVTLFGESAGGSNVFGLLASPLAAGLFHGAIIQSGSAETASLNDACGAIDDVEPRHASSAEEVLLRLIVMDGQAVDRTAAHALRAQWPRQAVAAFWRSRCPKQLVAAHSDALYAAFVAGSVPPLLVCDGHVIPTGGIDAALERGAGANIPLIIGTTREEFSIFLLTAGTNGFVRQNARTGLPVVDDPGRFHLAVEYLTRLQKASTVDGPACARVRSGGANVHMYRFDWGAVRPHEKTGGVSLGATHGLDVAFVLGNRRLPQEYAAAHLLTSDCDASYAVLADMMMAYWAEFARTGRPGCGDRAFPLWRPWHSNGQEEGELMIFDADRAGGCRMETALVTRAGIFADVAHDPRLTSDEDRRHFLQDMKAATPFSRITLADIDRFGGVAYGTG